MNKYHAALLLFLAFEQIQCFNEQNQPSEQNDISIWNTPVACALFDNGEALTAAIEQDPCAPLSKWVVLTAIRLNSSSAIKALAKIVIANPDKLAQYGLIDDLEALLASPQDQPPTLLMHAMHSSTEIALALLSIPAIAETINFSYDYKCLRTNYHAACYDAMNRDITYHSALSSALLTNSDMVEILLRHNATIPAPERFTVWQRHLLALAQQNIAHENNVYLFDDYLKTKRPEQALPYDILEMINSFLKTSSSFDEWH